MFEPFLFLVRKRNASPKKKYCSLRSPAAPRGARPPLISPWSMASWWKKPCNFPVDFVYYRDKRYFELILIQSIKKSVFQQTLEDVTPPVGWMWFFLIRFDLSAMSVNPSVRQSLSHTARFTKNTFNFSVDFYNFLLLI